MKEQAGIPRLCDTTIPQGATPCNEEKNSFGVECFVYGLIRTFEELAGSQAQLADGTQIWYDP